MTQKKKQIKLPIGISTLENIITDNYIYIDKTHHVENLVKSGKCYFLSRPRRFGKSLFVDTLKQAFLGNNTLFKGLYLENHWNWAETYPVIHIDFGGGVFRSREELEEYMQFGLDEHYKNNDITESPRALMPNNRLTYLIKEIFNKYNKKVVVLIDEYDKPILDNMTDLNTAINIREELKNFYSVLKSQEANLKFVFLTGVSKFSKVSLFSGLNNLNDISLDEYYSDICGYTQTELNSAFKNQLIGVDKTKLKNWYNGYNFGGNEFQKVYNPFDILLFFSKKCIYENYWFETATPSFLVRLMEKENYFVPNLEHVEMTRADLSTFDVDNIHLITLLFQTGYLTIKEVIVSDTRPIYVLSYPNLEVKFSLNENILNIGSNFNFKNENISLLKKCLKNKDFKNLGHVLNNHFASIPHDWYRNNNIANYEGYYASVVYSYFCALGYDLIAEDTTNKGKIDLTLKMPEQILIIEFKLSKHGTAQEALDQIKNKRYPEKYKKKHIPIYLIGMCFDEKERNMQECLWESL